MSTTMTSSQTYWAGFCKRKLEDSGVIDEALRGKIRSSMLPIKFIEDRTAQCEAWLLESIYTAITHDEVLLALRAYAQACQYFGWLDASGRNPAAYCSDALSTARNRVEDLMSRAA